jgi:hypothetical protein
MKQVTDVFGKVRDFVVKNKAFFISFLVLFGTYFTWWLAFFPGPMTSDSFDEWSQALTFKFTNASPYIYALVMSSLRVFGNTPAAMGLLQVLLFSLIIAIFINYAHKKGVSVWVLALTIMFFAVWPQFGIYNVTIWKDVMYSIFTLALGLSVFVYIIDKDKRNNYLLGLIAISSALVALFRFNGIIFLLVPAVIFLIFKVADVKKATILFFSTMAVYVFVAVVLFNALGVVKAPAMADGFMIKTIGGIYHLHNPNLDSFERKSFEALQPESDWKSLYNCTSQNAIVINVMKREKTGSQSPAIDPNPVEEANFHKAFYSAVLKNPQGYILDRLCQANNMLGFGSRNNFPYEDSIIWASWQPKVVEDSKAPIVKNLLEKDLQITDNVVWSRETKFVYDIFWSAWPMVIVLLIGLGISVWKKLPGLSIYVLFILFNLGTIMALAPAVDYRYIYFVYVCTPFVLALYFLEIKARKS